MNMGLHRDQLYAVIANDIVCIRYPTNDDDFFNIFIERLQSQKDLLKVLRPGYKLSKSQKCPKKNVTLLRRIYDTYIS